MQIVVWVQIDTKNLKTLKDRRKLSEKFKILRKFGDEYPDQCYHFQVDLIWRNNTFKLDLSKKFEEN